MKYQTWSRLAVSMIFFAAISGCVDDEPSVADIKASLTEAYDCAPELFDEIKITNVIPNNEHTKYVDFEWYITYKPSNLIQSLIAEAHDKERSDKMEKIFNQIVIKDYNSPERKDLGSELQEMREIERKAVDKLEQELKKTSIYKCNINAAKAAGYHFNGGFRSADSLASTVHGSASKIYEKIRMSYKRENIESLEQELSIGYESKKLMIKTKKGWRFNDHSVP